MFIIWVFPKIGEKPRKSSILIGVSIINHPFWDTPIFGNIHIFWLARRVWNEGMKIYMGLDGDTDSFITLLRASQFLLGGVFLNLMFHPQRNWWMIKNCSLTNLCFRFLFVSKNTSNNNYNSYASCTL